MHRNKMDSIVVLGNRYNREDFHILGVQFVSVKYNPHNKLICIFWELYLVTVALKKLNADRVLFPRGFAPLLHPTEDYVIIHDMIPFYYDRKFPGILNPLENFYIMWRLKASVRYSHGVITDSNASKEEILRITKAAEEKVRVIYPGQNRMETQRHSKETSIPAELEMLKDMDYISAMASGLPHKNAEGILKSYEEYCHKRTEPMRLVMIGLENIDAFSVPDEIKKHIICIKYLEEDTQMYQVIRGSRIFLFLSLQEGFGFPPLEAMQLGVPVVCSNVSSVPEVVGDAAVLVNPNDAEQVADQLLRLETDRELCGQYITKGYRNAERFLWERRIGEYEKLLFGRKH